MLEDPYASNNNDLRKELYCTISINEFPVDPYEKPSRETCVLDTPKNDTRAFTIRLAIVIRKS